VATCQGESLKVRSTRLADRALVRILGMLQNSSSGFAQVHVKPLVITHYLSGRVALGKSACARLADQSDSGTNSDAAQTAGERPARSLTPEKTLADELAPELSHPR